MSSDGADPLDTAPRVRLADVDPELLESLEGEDREEAKRLFLRTLDVPEGSFALGAILEQADAFAAIVLEGVLQHQLRIGDQLGLRLLGPGEIVGVGEAPRSMMLAGSEWRAAGDTRVVLLGREFLLALRRWPQVHARVQVRMNEQAERLATQLMICQLPRVEDRLLAMLWLLAESWGRVTALGTTVPMALTHEALGAMIGARRSTVTLALGELAHRGALVHQDKGWLLLERPPQERGSPAALEVPRLLGDGPTKWAAQKPVPDQPKLGAALSDTVDRLRRQHQGNATQLQALLRRIVAARVRANEVRERASQQRKLTRRRAPSS